MELEFTADQDELRETIRAVLTKESPMTLVRDVVEGRGDASKLWATMTELGWPALTVPEEHGGIGLGAIEAGILCEELGRAVAPGPLLPTVTQFVPLVQAFGTPEQQERFLAPAAAGELRGTAAVAETTGNFSPAATAATATRDGDEFVLAGRKRYVMAGDDADEIAIVVRAGDACALAVVAPAGIASHLRAINTSDRSRALVDVDLDGVRIPADRLLAPSPGTDVELALAEATVGIALEMVGTAQTIFDVTLEYAKEREQFGVPIGSFQALKHAFADMSIALERARATSYFASLTLAERDARWRTATSVAKIAAGDCQRLLGKQGIQLHGGIGYTWEHDMHLYVKRVKSGEPLFGTSAWHRDRLASLLLEG
jgi:alkylation response protein AidB-like acyl-CoA dehydrogenase